ncbi:MAG: MXAN_5187 C-terminal domain-containing protein [Bdellovibrionota bacterium]
MCASDANKRQIEVELDQLEAKISELRMLYEQYFVEILPHPPDKLQKEIVRNIRRLLRAPFKTSQTRFRLRTLVSRYQTYATYWERVQKQKDEGTYIKDVFKAEMREKQLEDAKRDASAGGKAEKGLKQLYDSYENALRKTGVDTSKINFNAFKDSLLKQAKQLKEKTGVQKLHYKVVVKNGKVSVKASGK